MKAESRIDAWLDQHGFISPLPRAALKETLLDLCNRVALAAGERVREECAKECDERSMMRDQYECDCRGYTRASEHNAEDIRALDVAALISDLEVGG